MPHYDAGMRDEGMGSRWTSKSPQVSSPKCKTFPELTNEDNYLKKQKQNKT